ncbi:MAG: hypothetical protein ACYC63_12495 [Armatimonadota bacterium]
MNSWTLALVVLAVTLTGLAQAQLDRTKLAEEYKRADAGYREGKGWSDSADSSTLGWSESSYLRNYANMWQATGDPYWLGKIEDHFSRILSTATDPDGDGFLGWQTAAYSAPVYWSFPLYNRGNATIEPAFFRELRQAKPPVTGHVYVIEFADPVTFTVQDQTTRKPVAEKQAYKPGEIITAIPGCKVKISGEPVSGDAFMVRTVASEPLEFAVHEGMIAYPAAMFIEAVKKDPKLQEQFGASADRFLAYINEHMLRKHEQHWLQVDESRGAWRFMDLVTERYPNQILPHNQYLALARALLVLKDVPGADPLAGRRAEQMARLFRSYLIEQGEAFVWHYWDIPVPDERFKPNMEDTSHGTIDVGFAIEAAQRGVVFTDADMKRFTRTMLDLMWNQSEEDPKLGPNVATRGDKFTFLTHDWIDLCRWEPRIYELALKTYQKKPATGVAPMLLRAESVCKKTD